MIVRKMVTVEQEVEVSITAEDMISELRSRPDDEDSQFELLSGLVSAIMYLKALPDAMLSRMTQQQLGVTTCALQEQLDRFRLYEE